MAALSDLIQKYGSLEKIPLSELNEAGYTRQVIPQDSGPITRVVRINVAEEEKPLPQKKALFGKLELLVKTSHAGNSLRGPKLSRLRELSFALYCLLAGDDSSKLIQEIFPKDNSLSYFLSHFGDYISGQVDLNEKGKDEAEKQSSVSSFGEFFEFWGSRGKITINYFPDYHGLTRKDLLGLPIPISEEIDFLTEEESEDLFSELEQLKARVLDLAEIKKRYNQKQEIIGLDVTRYTTNIKDADQFVGERSRLFLTFRDAIIAPDSAIWKAGSVKRRKQFAATFEKNGCKKVAEGLRQCQTASELLEFLTAEKSNFLYSFQKYQKQISESTPLPKVYLSPLLLPLVSDPKATAGDVKRVYVANFFESQGYQAIAAGLRQCRNTDECLEFLIAQKPDSLPSFQVQKSLRDSIRDAKTTDEKIRLSSSLKEAKQNIREEQKMLEGAIDFFSPYGSYANCCGKLIKSIQKLLVCDSSKEGQILPFFLDGTPSPEYDKNPGAVSGDCTENRPLPFYDHRVHNIKVFNPDQEHIGNIYLLESIAWDRRKVWHLEAIQVPTHCDNDFFVTSLVDVLSRAAREQKVDLITANSDSETISNYDYIALAAINFNEHNRLGKVDIRLPPCTIRPGYSRFQGSGIDSRILADLSKS